jgi:tRNA threonylcarbamoyladenosine biosynthesis protein TsaB
MPVAVALETSGRVGSVAFVRDGTVRAVETFAHGLQHAATILPMIDRLCRADSVAPDALDHVHLSIGPGSFTGLRVAVTIAKTLALAAGTKIVAVPSVRVLVENAPPDADHAIIVLDAKRGQVFTARFERVEGRWAEREPAHLDTLAAMLDRSPKPVTLVGEGISYHREAIGGREGVIVSDETLWRARAEVLAALGGERAAGGEFADPLTLTPIYIRLPEAEEKRRLAMGEHVEGMSPPP